MPSVSKRQHNAMEAAAHGHSTLGIPASVGEDYVSADQGKPVSKMGKDMSALAKGLKRVKDPKGK